MKNKNILFVAMIALLLASCDKENQNEAKIAGAWKGVNVIYTYYENNSPVKDSTVSNEGSMYLYDDNDLQNQFETTLLIPLVMNVGNHFYWEATIHKLNQFYLAEYTWDELQVNTHSFSIEKCTDHKLILNVIAVNDASDLLSKKQFVFER